MSYLIFYIDPKTLTFSLRCWLITRNVLSSLFTPLSVPLCFPTTPITSEADDLAQYLDHLLAHSAPKKAKPQVGGLGRFKAVATKTKEMVSLMNKAQDLNIHSEWSSFFNKYNRFDLENELWLSIRFIFYCPDVNMYLPSKLFRSRQPSLNLNLTETSSPQETQVDPVYFFCSLVFSFDFPRTQNLYLFSLKAKRFTLPLFQPTFPPSPSSRARRCRSRWSAASPKTPAEPSITALWSNSCETPKTFRTRLIYFTSFSKTSERRLFIETVQLVHRNKPSETNQISPHTHLYYSNDKCNSYSTSFLVQFRGGFLFCLTETKISIWVVKPDLL